MKRTKILLLAALSVAATASCGGAPSHTNISNIGTQDKTSLPTPSNANSYSANANNPQMNANSYGSRTPESNSGNR